MELALVQMDAPSMWRLGASSLCKPEKPKQELQNNSCETKHNRYTMSSSQHSGSATARPPLCTTPTPDRRQPASRQRSCRFYRRGPDAIHPAAFSTVKDSVRRPTTIDPSWRLPTPPPGSR